VIRAAQQMPERKFPIDNPTFPRLPYFGAAHEPPREPTFYAIG
jgi:hypothetical protein